MTTEIFKRNDLIDDEEFSRMNITQIICVSDARPVEDRKLFRPLSNNLRLFGRFV